MDQGESMRILFVEDNNAAQKLIMDVFGDQDITIAGDYVTATNQLNHGKFDLVVTDIFFPQETGSGKKELAKELEDRLVACQDQELRAWVRSSRRNFLKMEKFLKDKNIMIKGNKKTRLLEEKEDIKKTVSWIKKTKEGIEGWATSPKEDLQPLGILVAERCEREGIPFRMASSLYHHSKMVQAVCDFARSCHWPEIFDLCDEEYVWDDSQNNPKESRLFWEELRKRRSI